MGTFVHLHAHSHYSLLEGLPKIDELVQHARRLGFDALALTDYGSMYGAIEFYKTARKAGIRPIIGCEAYVARASRLDKTIHADNPDSHLILLAENYTGYKNLMILSSLGHMEGFSDKPRIDKEALFAHHEGIIALSGCMDGEIPKLLLARRTDDARAALQSYRGIFGAEHFFLELQDHPERAGQVEVNNALIELGRETGTPLVVTRDVHYLSLEDRDAQDILTCIKHGRTVNDPDRARFTHIDRSLNTAEDMRSRFRHAEDALENTVKIATRCNVEIPLGTWRFPPIPIPEGKTAEEVLRENTLAGLRELVGEITKVMHERLEYELGIIGTKGYSPYFLAVADYTKWAREHGIIATTRGSAAGSLVSYAIGITTVNPLDFKLPFERFLNPYRPSPPDIDMDFADDRRDEVIAYVTEKYGADKVAQIITFGTMAARGSVRDVGRALGLSYSFCDQVAKAIPMGSQGFPMTIQKALEITPELYALYNENKEVKRLLDLAQKIEGGARHTSIHAAGVVIAPAPLTDFTPIQHETGGTRVTTQYDMSSVEDAGLLKMDFLGIRNLSILGTAVKIAQKTRGITVDLQKIPWDDALTYHMLSEGKTGGLFQLGGSGMTRYLIELKPSNLFDIMAMVALFRPGPMESIPEFIRRKHNPKLITYLDDRMKEYLDMSYGVITYQDDVLLTAIKIAGYSWEAADKLRKAMGKKIPAEMASQKEKFITGCIGSGLKNDKAQALWKLIEPFAAYGFNKAHAASYAVVAFQTAYMKAHFPEEYMAAVLSAESGDIETVAQMVDECARMGIPVLPPDVNESFELFAVAPGRRGDEAQGAHNPIRFGLTAIKNVGNHIAEVVIRERKARGPFAHIEDFLRRIQDKDLNKKSLESLIKCGAMDRFGDRGFLMGNVDTLLAFNKDAQKSAATNQISLFGASGTDAARLMLKQFPSARKSDRLAWEKELLGLYVSEHPFSEWRQRIGQSARSIADILKDQSRANEWVALCGMVMTAKKIITKKGSAMLFVQIEDATGSIEAVVFPKTYEQYKRELVEGAFVCIWGKYSERENEKKIITEKVEALTDATWPHVQETLRMAARSQGAQTMSHAPMAMLSSLPAEPFDEARAARAIRIEIRVPSEAPRELIGRLKTVFESHGGGACAVELVWKKDGAQQHIVTPYKVRANAALHEALRTLLGQGAITYHE